MRKFSVLIHLKDAPADLTRTIQSLQVSDEVLLIDHLKNADLSRAVHDHGAKLVPAIDGVQDGAYVSNAGNDWVLCLRPCEQVSDALSRALQRWKEEDEQHDAKLVGYTVEVNGRGELRFVNRKRLNWMDELPAFASNVRPMPGELLPCA